MKSIYIIGSLRNPKIPEFANTLTRAGFEAFSDWFAPGPAADDYFRDYSKVRGWSYKQALQSHAAKHIFAFDRYHLDRADIAILLMPAGRSGHLELGYHLGKGKPGYILFDEVPERYDMMLQFATELFFDEKELIDKLRGEHNEPTSLFGRRLLTEGGNQGRS